MPITSNATANMSRRQSFNGKGLTFIEVIFDTAITDSATTPDTNEINKHLISESKRKKLMSVLDDLGQLRKKLGKE